MTWPENVFTQSPSSNADEYDHGSDFPLFRVPSASCQLSRAGTNTSWESALVRRVNHCTRSIELLACRRSALFSPQLPYPLNLRGDFDRGSQKKNMKKIFWGHVNLFCCNKIINSHVNNKQIIAESRGGPLTQHPTRSLRK